MDDGWSAFAIALILFGACKYMEYRDKRAGMYPRRWKD